MFVLLEDLLTILYDDALEVACNLLTSQVEDSTLSNLVLYGRNASFVNLGRCNLDRRYQDITSARVLLEGVRACGETEFNDIAVFCSYVIMSIVRTVYVNIALTVNLRLSSVLQEFKEHTTFTSTESPSATWKVMLVLLI